MSKFRRELALHITVLALLFAMFAVSLSFIVLVNDALAQLSIVDFSLSLGFMAGVNLFLGTAALVARCVLMKVLKDKPKKPRLNHAGGYAPIPTPYNQQQNPYEQQYTSAPQAQNVNDEPCTCEHHQPAVAEPQSAVVAPQPAVEATDESGNEGL